MHTHSNRRWHLNESLAEARSLWRAMDHKGEVLQSLVTKRQDKRPALKLQ